MFNRHHVDQFARRHYGTERTCPGVGAPPVAHLIEVAEPLQFIEPGLAIPELCWVALDRFMHPPRRWLALGRVDGQRAAVRSRPTARLDRLGTDGDE